MPQLATICYIDNGKGNYQLKTDYRHHLYTLGFFPLFSFYLPSIHDEYNISHYHTYP